MCCLPFGWVEKVDARLTQQEAVACRNQLNAGEKAAEMAKTEEQKASLDYQAASLVAWLPVPHDLCSGFQNIVGSSSALI